MPTEPTAPAKRAAEAIHGHAHEFFSAEEKARVAAIIDAEVRPLVERAEKAERERGDAISRLNSMREDRNAADKQTERLQVELGKLKTDFEATLLDRNELLAHYQKATAKVLALEAERSALRACAEALKMLHHICLQPATCAACAALDALAKTVPGE